LAKNRDHALKNENFEKMKKTPPGFHSRNNCAKFHPNPTICEVSSLPASFWRKIVTTPLKMKILKK